MVWPCFFLMRWRTDLHTFPAKTSCAFSKGRGKTSRCLPSSPLGSWKTELVQPRTIADKKNDKQQPSANDHCPRCRSITSCPLTAASSAALFGGHLSCYHHHRIHVHVLPGVFDAPWDLTFSMETLGHVLLQGWHNNATPSTILASKEKVSTVIGGSWRVQCMSLRYQLPPSHHQLHAC